MAEITVLVLGVALAVACLGATALALRVVLGYQRALSQATELAIRHQDENREYERRALADARAAGRLMAEVPEPETPPGVTALARELEQVARGAVNDAGLLR